MDISINAFLPDADLDKCKVNEAIMVTAMKIRQNSAGLPLSPMTLEVNFLLPGQNESPDFSGMRIRNFDADSKLLTIEASVPAKMLNSVHANKYVLAVLMDSLDNAAEFLKEQAILFNPSAHLKMLEELDEKVASA